MLARRTTPLALALILLGSTLAALPAAGAAQPAKVDFVLPSFDGTPLAATLFTPAGADDDHPVPFVLMTHGWAGSRATQPTGRVGDLLAAGYGVLTWDSRGFGQSGGEVMLDSPDFEVKDVQALLDHLETLPVALKDADGDLVVGMSGGSYAGGIQLLSAAFDERIDAIAPEITWNDLVQSLAPNGVPKLAWTSLLFGAGQATSCSAGAALAPAPTTGCQTSKLAQWYAQVHATNAIPDEVRAELLARSPATYMDSIDVPTLLVQGFHDTLFDVDQAVANYEGVKANGAPAKLWLYDGGHGYPWEPIPNTQGAAISAVVVAWLDCHLKPAAECSRVGPEVEWYGGDGQWRSASSWPPPQLAQEDAFAGVPPLVQGPVPTARTLPNGADYGQAVLPLDKAPAGVARTASGGARVWLDVGSQAPEAYVFASLAVRRADGSLAAVAGQTQPVRVETPLSDTTSVHIDLVDVSAAWKDGEELVLVLAAAHPYYDGNRAPTFLYLEDVRVAWGVDA